MHTTWLLAAARLLLHVVLGPFVFSVDGSQAAGEALSRVIANDVGWVFVTDGTASTPWGQLPGYFDDEVRAI